MAFFWIVSVLAVVSVHGQFTPGPKPSCQLEDVVNGPAYIAHETYCQLYYQCDLAPNQFTRMCGNNTLWDPLTSTCNYPAKNQCPTWPCDASRAGTKYPDVCCNKFWECTGSGFERGVCQNGYNFQVSTGQCVLSNQFTCNDNIKCTRNAINDGIIRTCSDQPDPQGRECYYITQEATITHENRPCPAGTSFNASSCSCSTLNPNCPLNPLDVTANKQRDDQCRASMRTSFVRGSPEMYTDKLTTSNVKLPYIFNPVAYLSSNNQGQLTRSQNGDLPYLYNYYFNLNQLGTPLAIAVAFKYNNPIDGTEVQVLTNDVPSINVPNTICGEATIDATARYSSFNQQWTFSVTLKGDTGRTDTATDSIRLNGQNFVELLIMFDETLTIQLIDRGISGTDNNPNNVVRTASNNVNIGKYIAYTKCGLVICKGLDGFISKFNVYEGCGDFSRISV